MVRVLIVRHGETEANRLKIVQGKKLDYPLNETGFQQADLLAQRLAKEKIDHIYTSPQRRAYQTAEAISRLHPSTPLTVRLDLAENSMGVIDGMNFTELDKKFPNLDWDDEATRQMLGAESHAANHRHFSRHWPAFFKPHNGHTILLSTHGGRLKTLLRSLVTPDHLEWINREHPQNTSVSEVHWTPLDGGRLLMYNDTAHLSEPALATQVFSKSGKK